MSEIKIDWSDSRYRNAKPGTIDRWVWYAGGSTHGLTDGEILAVATACHEKTERGEQTCVWHEAHALFVAKGRATGDCECATCARERKAKA